MAKVQRDEASGCWHWTGAVQTYGVFAATSRSKVKAHRWSFEHFVGPIPDGHTVDHLCQVQRCVNPAHLEAVTQAENNRRSRAAQRMKSS